MTAVAVGRGQAVIVVRVTRRARRAGVLASQGPAGHGVIESRSVPRNRVVARRAIGHRKS